MPNAHFDKDSRILSEQDIMDLGITVSMNAGYWVDEAPYQIYDNEFGINAPKLSRASHFRKVGSGVKVLPKICHQVLCCCPRSWNFFCAFVCI